jgi:hypothetical protein
MSGMTALFACAIGITFAALAPFGLCIYLGDMLGYHGFIAMGATVSVYAFYYIIARYFNLIEGI